MKSLQKKMQLSALDIVIQEIGKDFMTIEKRITMEIEFQDQPDNKPQKQEERPVPMLLQSKHLKNISKEQAEVIQYKYASPRMAVRANDMLFPSECDALLIRICVITGWQMPGIPMLQKAVKSEFEHYCRENCADLNPDEICYALRQFALEIKDWGKDINLQLIDEPIRSYRSVRHEVSALESEVPDPEVKQISGCPEDFTEEWDRLIDGFDPVNPFYQLVPFSLFYDWLRRQNRIFPTGKNILDARDNVLARLQRKIPQLPHERQEIERMKCINWYKDPKVLRYISTEVKTITVKQLLHKLKAERNENS